jgi:hypothetical protein
MPGDTTADAFTGWLKRSRGRWVAKVTAETSVLCRERLAAVTGTGDRCVLSAGA